MANKVELLSPAGDFNKGKFALNYGADAIYLGAKAYSLRARASNFDFDELAKIIDYAHSLNKKIYAYSKSSINTTTQKIVILRKKMLKRRLSYLRIKKKGPILISAEVRAHKKKLFLFDI